MNSYIKKQAEHLSQTSHIDHPHKVQQYTARFHKCLNRFQLPEDKIAFLSYYQQLMDDILAKHRKRCQRNHCTFMSTSQTVTFIISQQLAVIKKEQQRAPRFTAIAENLAIAGSSQVPDFEKVQSDIRHNIESLSYAGHQQISQSIAYLANAIKETGEINDRKKKDYLDNLKLLSDEALKPKHKRLPHSTLQYILRYGVGTSQSLSSLSAVTTASLPFIADYFQNK